MFILNFNKKNNNKKKDEPEAPKEKLWKILPKLPISYIWAAVIVALSALAVMYSSQCGSLSIGSKVFGLRLTKGNCINPHAAIEDNRSNLLNSTSNDSSAL